MAMSAFQRDVVIGQDGAGPKVIRASHHQPPRQDADGPFENAHVDVHGEYIYILALKKRGGEGDDSGVGGAQKFLHGRAVNGKPSALSIRQMVTVMGLDTAVTQPHERLATHLADDMTAVNVLIRERMASEHAPRIPK
jgi:octaprenyl-diphosphate synthase